VGPILVLNENMPLPPHPTVGFTHKLQPPLAPNFLPPKKLESLAPNFPIKDKGKKEKEKKKSVKLARNS
jgi:hypothetical protein